MHSAALFLSIQWLAFHVDDPSSVTSRFPRWHLGNAIGHSRPDLDFPCYGHWIAPFLVQGSAVSVSDVALRPARKLFFLLELILMTRLRTSRVRQQNSGFPLPSHEQAEPTWTAVERLKNNTTQTHQFIAFDTRE